ncbi:hypothetical protein Tco_0099372 [Tanacetum coccineum]
MAESSSDNPSSPKITLKEEPITLDRPERSNPCLTADQIDFSFNEIAFTTNNEVALLYPSHLNSEYFREVSDFISKCCLKEAFIRAPTQYKEYLCKKPGAKSGLRRKHSSKHSSESHTEASKSKTGQLEKETQSSSAKDKSPSHPLPPTPLVGEMHKEAHQAAGGPTSLGATSEERVHPQLSRMCGCDALADSTTEADPGLFAPNDSIPSQQASHDIASCLPTKLKELPLKFTELSGDIKKLKQHVHDMEIDLTSQVAELKNIQWELPTEFLDLPSLPLWWKMHSGWANRTRCSFSRQELLKTSEGGEKNTNPATTDVEPNLHDKLVNLLVRDVVTQYYNKKLLYGKYCDKMLKRIKSFKITNSDVLTQKGPILLKLHREDGTIKVISNVKVNDLHLAKWREVVQACLDRKEKGWKTIYGLIKTIMEYLDQTEKELKIDFNKPLKEQDPLNELYDLANKKRKRTGHSTDHSKSTKKHKSSV